MTKSSPGRFLKRYNNSREKDFVKQFKIYPYFFFHIASVLTAEIWLPSINKAVLRACVLYAATCSGISLGELKWFPCVQAC